MELATILSFALLAALLVNSPGPNGLLVARSLAMGARDAAWGNIAGFVAAFYLHGTFAILGFSVLIMQSTTAFLVFKLLGALYLCWIGLKSLWTAITPQAQFSVPGRAGAVKRKPQRWDAFVEGFLTNALNPKVSVFYLAAFPQFLSTNPSGAVAGFTLVTLHAVLNALWFAAIIGLASRLGAASRPDWLQRLITGATGAIFIGFGVKLATLRP